MGDFAYAYFGGLKYGVLNEMTQGVFDLFVYAWSLFPFCNVDYTSKTSFLER